jgi:hypothetical protein
MSIHVTHVSNYTVIDIMTVSNADLYIMLARSSSYFRVLQEGAGFKFLHVNFVEGPVLFYYKIVV